MNPHRYCSYGPRFLELCNNFENIVRFLEAMNARYENHSYFTAQLAIRMEALRATAIDTRLLRQVSTLVPLSQTASDDCLRPSNP